MSSGIGKFIVFPNSSNIALPKSILQNPLLFYDEAEVMVFQDNHSCPR